MSAPGSHIQIYSRTEASPLEWRLLSGNNREIARGIDTFPDIESCRLALKELQEIAPNLERRISRVDANRWVWALVDAGRAVVHGHAVDRLIRCEQALTLAVDQLVSASIGGGVMVSGARRWRSAPSRHAETDQAHYPVQNRY